MLNLRSTFKFFFSIALSAVLLSWSGLAFADTEFEHVLTHNTYNNCSNGTDCAQTFTATANYNLTSVNLLMSQGHDVTTCSGGNMTLGLRATTGGGTAPTGSDIATSNSVACSGLSSDFTNGSIQTFTFSSPPALTSGTSYALYLVVSSNDVQWFSNTGNPYSGGNWWRSDTGSDLTLDFYFDNYGTTGGGGGSSSTPAALSMDNFTTDYRSPLVYILGSILTLGFMLMVFKIVKGLWKFIRKGIYDI